MFYRCGVAGRSKLMELSQFWCPPIIASCCVYINLGGIIMVVQLLLGVAAIVAPLVIPPPAQQPTTPDPSTGI
jgi:hypothetical protein